MHTSRVAIRWIAAVASLLLLTSAVFAEEVQLQTEDQKMLYALGMAVAIRIPYIHATPEEITLIEAGLADGLSGATPRVDMPTYGPKLEQFVQTRVEAAAKAQEAAGDKYRAEAAKQSGAVKTDSGLIVIEMTPGDGAQPTDSDSVKVNYKGTLIDGTVFDSSIDRGAPATFAVASVVPCFSEGLKRMKVGEKAKLICPPDLAYGNRGGPRIPPGATLVFEVELLDIVKNPAPSGGE